MLMEILEYLAVMGVSAFKVMFGVGVASLYGMEWWEIFVTVALGGTVGIAIYAMLGREIRDRLLQRRREKGHSLTAKQISRIRFILKIWKRWGLLGIAFLTPPFLTPPGGTLIALAFGERTHRIILFLGASMVAWSLVFAVFSETIIQLIHPTVG